MAGRNILWLSDEGYPICAGGDLIAINPAQHPGARANMRSLRVFRIQRAPAKAHSAAESAAETSMTQPATGSRSDFDAELIRRYDVNGPRYTSYPTANLFAESFDPDTYRRSLEDLPADARLSLYLHVPFCATICYYCACNKIVTNNRTHAVAYLERLHREIAMVSALLPPGHEVEQMHFGGGTPTYLTDPQLESLFARLADHFHLSSGAERDFSIEIDPRTVDPERMRSLIRLGINRVSLGVQDFDPQVQTAVNRLQSVAETRAVIDAARAGGVGSVSIDLIYGLPLQTLSRFAVTLEKVLDLAPDRISLYSYAHLPQRFKTQRQIDVVDLPDAQTKLALLQMAIETLAAMGYAYIGMDHFARRSDPLVTAQRDGTLHRNFQGYTTHRHCELVGLGVSAISSVGSVYAQNCKDLERYYHHVDAGRLPVERGLEMTPEDELRRDVIVSLMCHFHLDIERFQTDHDVDFHRHFARELAALVPMAKQGLVTVSPTAIEVTPRGRFLIRNVCMVFDAYLPATTTGFSKAI
jgi:oxygen-independent coproporphyrinogen III oxidase